MATTTARIVIKGIGEAVQPINGYAVDVTLNENDRTAVIDCTAAPRSITLPPAAGHPGRIFAVKKGDASANAMTILPTGADTVEGGASVVRTTQNEVVTLQSDGGTNWHEIGNNFTGLAPTSPWDTTAGVIHPHVLANEVSVGTASSFGKFSVLGDTAAQITTVIRAAPAQTADIFVVEDNAGTDIFQVTTAGAIVTGKLTVTGAIDPTEIVLSGGGTAHFMEWGNGTTAPDAGAGVGRIRYNDTTKTFQFSADSVTYTNLSGVENLQEAYDGGNTITTTTADGVPTFTRGATALAAEALLSLIDANASAGRTASLIDITDSNSGAGHAVEITRTVGAGDALRVSGPTSTSAVSPITDASSAIGTSSLRYTVFSASTGFRTFITLGDANPAIEMTTTRLAFGAGGASAVDVVIERGAADRLDLASGDSLRLINGDIQFAGTAETISRTAGEILLTTATRVRTTAELEIDGALNHDGTTVGFYGTAPIAQQVGVAVTAAAIHAACVALGLFTA